MQPGTVAAALWMVPFALDTVHDTDGEDANDVTTTAASAAAAWQLASASTTAAVTARFMKRRVDKCNGCGLQCEQSGNKPGSSHCHVQLPQSKPTTYGKSPDGPPALEKKKQIDRMSPTSPKLFIC